MKISQEKGSEIAKEGFKTEREVLFRFKNWREDPVARSWLISMGYNLDEIESVSAILLSGYKADIQVQIRLVVKLKSAIDAQNIQIKLVSNSKGFNQIDKRWVDRYVELWNIPQEIALILKYYTGEYPPFINQPKDFRRMFANEFPKDQQELLLGWLNENKILIINDLMKGRGKFAAEWMLIIKKNKEERSILLPMNICMNYFGEGEILITPRGSIRIGRITMQRKGGDGGRPSANMLQFKINPTEIFPL